jgi:hypothetical protein
LITVTFADGIAKYNKDILYQYDYGESLEVKGLTLTNGTQFHFANKGATAYTVISETTDGVTTAKIPQKVLEQNGEMNVYIYSASETSGRTLATITFNVRGREKPGNYAPPDEPNIVETFKDQLDKIIATGTMNFTPDPVKTGEIVQDYVTDNLLTDNLTSNLPGTALDARQGKALDDKKLDKTQVGISVASLGEDGKVPPTQLPTVNSDTKDSTVTFDLPTVDAEMLSGDTHATLFGKIKKRLIVILDTLSSKFDKVNIAQTDEINDPTKVPSTSVIAAIKTLINNIINDLLTTVINSNMTYETVVASVAGSFAYKSGKVVTITCLLDLGSNVTAANTKIAHINNYPPKGTVYSNGVAYTTTATTYSSLIMVDTNGDIRVQGFTSRYLAFSVSYLMA